MTDPTPATPHPVAVKAAVAVRTAHRWEMDPKVRFRDSIRVIDAEIRADPLLSAAGEMAEALRKMTFWCRWLKRYGQDARSVLSDEHHAEVREDIEKADAVMERAGIE